MYKKVSKTIAMSLVLYVDDILFIGNGVLILWSINRWTLIKFSTKDLRMETDILGTRIYIDRSRKYLGLSQTLHIDKILNKFCIEVSKREILFILHTSLFKSMFPKIQFKREIKSMILYTSLKRLILYVIIYTRLRLNVSYTLSICS